LILWIHILSGTLLFGTGLGTAFHGWMPHRSGDLRTIAVATRSVVLADWLFTAPAVIVQPATGAWLAWLAELPLDTGWIALSLGLYALTGACWLPVVWLQIRMHRLAADALRRQSDLPQCYHRHARYWFVLGWPAFVAVVAIFYLMVIKPDLLSSALVVSRQTSQSNMNHATRTGSDVRHPINRATQEVKRRVQKYL
jgi:uncharacterized membrane protein